MSYFWDTIETIPEGMGFSHFDFIHLSWIALFFVVVFLGIRIYRPLDPAGRSRFQKCWALALLADELFKDIGLLYSGHFMLKYLPLHLCSINIFLIAWYAWKPNRTLGSFLYTVCIPGAMAAIFFSDWTALPLLNFIHIHSFTVHILLAGFPIILFAAGDIQPRLKDIPGCLLVLAVLALLVWPLNMLWNANFMFLAYAEPGNPLYLFQEIFGTHLAGFPVLIALVLLVMYGPLYAAGHLKTAPSKSESL